MTWRLVHHFVDSPCERGTRLTRFGIGGRGSCPQGRARGVSAELGDAITELLRKRGIDYYPGPTNNSMLWCLGGHDLYRDQTAEHVADLISDACVDLHLNVCRKHEAISIDLFPLDLVGETGGSGPDDPRRSQPIELGEAQDVVELVLGRLEPWLDEILVLPR